ncbi:MAG: KH domain-containing protein [Coriobacteriia bacterium]|nr:KH domain-containing protein [Coriobacteriia bacterium]MBS5479097.1 KH domain-containing protein [Coriobacteriia bacterium]
MAGPEAVAASLVEGEQSDAGVPEEYAEIARKVSAGESLTDDELDQVADAGIAILRTLLSYFDAENATIDEYDSDAGQLIFNVTGEDLGILIGYHGKVLDSFKFMFSTLLNNELGFRFPATVDIEGYENRRLSKLENLAKSAARKAVQRGSEVRLHPMKPYERRIVHLVLRNDRRVTTHSEGSEPNRCVVVVPAK